MGAVLSLWKGEIAPATSMRDIAEDVARRNGITVEELRGSPLPQRYSWPRQEFMHLAYLTGRYSTTQIGNFLSGRAHTTVVHGIRRHRERIGFVQTPET